MIQYPNKKKVTTSISTTSRSRGMDLEKDINDSNLFYKDCNRALIYKKPTPVQIVKVDYPSRKSAKIIEAYYQVPSTTDYNGIYRGKYIDFEAKETKSKTSFPFQNIHPHQIQHLKKVMEHDGIAFMMIRFQAKQETYLLEASKLLHKYESKESKSLPYTYIQEEGYLIEEGYMPRLKYLDIVDAVYFKEEL